MAPSSPIRTDIVLVGGGHAHVFVLRMFGMRPEPGVRLTLVAKELEAPYSGMLPGLIAGHYRHEECHIDLTRLAQFAGARLIGGEAEGIDRASSRIILRDGSALAYDILSVNVGITPASDGLVGAENVLAVKPISAFWPRWQELERRIRQPDGPRRIAVVGGGAAGFELVLAIRERLGQTCSLALIAGDHLLPAFSTGARRRARAALVRGGIDLVEGDPATSFAPGALRLASGAQLPFDAALLSTGASPPSWFRRTGLPLDPAGFLALKPTLQSEGDPAVFAAGDCAVVTAYPRPRAGVFAVRQGPVLGDNLRRAARGEAPRSFRPQDRFLTLLATGPKHAIAARGGLATAGRWVWRWKDAIDRRFMSRFHDLPEMKGG